MCPFPEAYGHAFPTHNVTRVVQRFIVIANDPMRLTNAWTNLALCLVIRLYIMTTNWAALWPARVGTWQPPDGPLRSSSVHAIYNNFNSRYRNWILDTYDSPVVDHVKELWPRALGVGPQMNVPLSWTSDN